MTTKAVASSKANQVMTPEFRVSFPAVFAPRAMEGQEPKYSVVMLFGKGTDLNPLKLAVKQAVIDKWGPDQTKWPKGLRLPFRNGAEKDYDGYGADVTFCTATTKLKPGLVDQERNDIIAPNEFYGGCYARATVNAYAYDVKGNKGVALGLRNVQKTRDGEPFSGRNNAKDDFDAIPLPAGASKAQESDPLEGLGA